MSSKLEKAENNDRGRKSVMPPNRMNRTMQHKRGGMTDRSMVSGFSGDDLDYDTADLSSDSEHDDDRIPEPEFNLVQAQPSLTCCIFG